MREANQNAAKARELSAVAAGEGKFCAALTEERAVRKCEPDRAQISIPGKRTEPPSANGEAALRSWKKKRGKKIH